MKAKVSYVCQECGYDSPAFLGKCPECGVWNSFKQIRLSKEPSVLGFGSVTVSQTTVAPKTLKEIDFSEKERISTGFSEMDMVLGGGIVPGGVSLIAGDPGVGKSTLLLQLCLLLSEKGKKVLYISGEESPEQIKMRATRLLGKKKENEHLLVLSLTDPDAGIAQIQDIKPALVVVDSVQTLQSENVAGLAGSIAQIRYGTLHFVKAAKTLNIPVLLVGHVTKEGMVAGPMLLSHMVDTVLFLEGEKFSKTRILRSLKNRFGPIDEVGIFLMEEEGMIEVKSPEQIFLTKESHNAPGSVLVATMEGSRAFLIELQALVIYSKLPMPRRVVSGIDVRRVELLLAVLKKHCNLPVDTMDVFVNIAGGMRLSDPAIDLGVCLSVYSSLKNIPLANTVGIAEVGLLGELRAVTGLNKRIREAEKLGFKKILTAVSYKSLRDVLESLNEKFDDR